MFFLHEYSSNGRFSKIASMKLNSDHLKNLIEGNERFVHGESIQDRTHLKAKREQLVAGQMPFAVIVGCSDSRVPIELVFDQDLGDLFVIRVAGNLVDELQMASVEYAVQMFNVSLVIVLGHTHCGAVETTLDVMLGPANPDAEPNAIVEKIKPAIAGILDQGLEREDLSRQAVHLNAKRSAKTLLEGSTMLGQMHAAETLQVLSAEYDLNTGKVTLLD